MINISKENTQTIKSEEDLKDIEIKETIPKP
jgi:hypothetical protein